MHYSLDLFVFTYSECSTASFLSITLGLRSHKNGQLLLYFIFMFRSVVMAIEKPTTHQVRVSSLTPISSPVVYKVSNLYQSLSLLF